jgi:hypothetical protein
MAFFIIPAEGNLPVPRKSRERKLVPAMVNISAASNETNKFQFIPFRKAAAGVCIRFNDDVVQLDNDGRWDNFIGLKKQGDSDAD